MLAKWVDGILLSGLGFGSRLRDRFLGHSNGHGLGGGFGLGLLGVQAANLELALELLQDALVVVFPELLRGILAGYALENLLAAF